MKNTIKVLILFTFVINCNQDDSFPQGKNGEVQSFNCDTVDFPDWVTSNYVLPYEVGKTYSIGLGPCSSSYHASGQPDQFAIDFDMPIGDEITASTSGIVVFVEESGNNYQFPNNKVVIKAGELFVQYMHLTKNGSAVNEGDSIEKGDLIGYSGATGLAGYPHLHLVITNSDGWEYPYDSVPVTFSNTSPNPNSLESGETYTAESY